MTSEPKDDAPSPPSERGRSAREAGRVGVSTPWRFNRSATKTSRARDLRHDSTDVEMKLWQKLRNRKLGVDFRRQHPAGNFILDFYAPSLGLVVELDGGQHSDSQHIRSDDARTRWLAERGVTVLRFWNSDVSTNLSGVLEVIAAKVAELKDAGAAPVRRWSGEAKSS
jgi:very-short-patch-repair endonuclease